jgi:hypothetical protein
MFRSQEQGDAQMKTFLLMAVLVGFIGVGLTGCNDTKASGSKTTSSVVKPDGGKMTETKTDEKKETPPKP